MNGRGGNIACRPSQVGVAEDGQQAKKACQEGVGEDGVGNVAETQGPPQAPSWDINPNGT